MDAASLSAGTNIAPCQHQHQFVSNLAKSGLKLYISPHRLRSRGREKFTMRVFNMEGGGRGLLKAEGDDLETRLVSLRRSRSDHVSVPAYSQTPLIFP